MLFTSRGFVIDNLMYDGVPAEGNFSTDSIDETLDTALYDRIEIVRGATGLMTGAGSPAASVNLLRKHADSKELATSLGFTAGSWNDRRFEGDISTPLTSDGDVRARFVGVYQDTRIVPGSLQQEEEGASTASSMRICPRTRRFRSASTTRTTSRAATPGARSRCFSRMARRPTGRARSPRRRTGASGIAARKPRSPSCSMPSATTGRCAPR